MALNNLSDHLKTSPTTAPPSLGAVRHQLRFWGMGNPTGNARSVPELQTKMGRYSLSSKQHMANIQRRASELQLGVAQADSAVSAGMAEDESNLNEQRLDNYRDRSEEDLLSQASRAVAGTVAVGKALRVTTSALGLESITAFLDKVPLIGQTKEVRKANELQEELMEAYRQQDFKTAEVYARTLEMVGDSLKNYNTIKGRLLEDYPPERVNGMLSDTNLLKEFYKLQGEFRDFAIDSELFGGLFAPTGLRGSF